MAKIEFDKPEYIDILKAECYLEITGCVLIS